MHLSFKKISLFLFSIFCWLLSLCAYAIDFYTIPTRYVLSFENVTLPHTHQSMGLLGLHYLLHTQHQLYGGIGSYAAMTGQRGGLFVLGIDAGITPRLFNSIITDINLFAGGGGGRNDQNDEGGGLMVRPSINLLYPWQLYQFGLGFSYVIFPNGYIRSYNVVLTFSLNSRFYYLPGNFETQGDIIQLIKKSLILHHAYFTIQNHTYFQPAQTVQVIGVESGVDLSTHWFGYLQTAGAYDGMPNGYMALLGGVGYSFDHPISRLHWQLKLGAGAAGGGGAKTGGGFIIEPEIIASIPIYRTLSLDIGPGYLWSPEGNFHAITFLASLTHYFGFWIPDQNYSSTNQSVKATLQNWSIMLQHITYFNSQRSSVADNQNRAVQLIGVSLHYLLSPSWYFIGEGASAYAGDAGSYASGLLGLGIQTPIITHRLHFYMALLGGAAGGGGIDVHHGLVWQPRIGLDIAAANNLSTVCDYSRIIAVRGRLRANVLTIGLAYHFGEASKIK